MSELFDKVRGLILESSESPASICQATEVSPSSMSQFLAGDKGLSMNSIDRVLKHLGYSIELKRSKGAK